MDHAERLSDATGRNLRLVNGTVLSVDGSPPRHRAVAIRSGQIAAVGDNSEILALDIGKAEIVDLAGSFVLPGFIDSHVHAFATGLTMVSADLGRARDVADVCRRMREHALANGDAAWVLGLGCTPWTLAERRFPTREELDAAVPDRPVYVTSATFHSGAANSIALRQILAEGSVAETRVEIMREGWFLDDESHFAAGRVAFGSLSDAEITELYRRVAQHAASKGVTALHCLEGQFIQEDRDVLALISSESQLPVHVVLMYQTMDVDRVLALGLPRIGGCLTVDGACFEHTAAFYEPYLDAPNTRGSLNYSEETIADFVSRAHGAGLQIGMHAIGDRAIDTLVRCYSAAQTENPRHDARHRVEHFQLPSEWAIEEVQRLGLALPMQPVFSHLWDHPDDSDYERSFGVLRAERMEPFGRLARLGLHVSGGSDSPVTPIDPLTGIHAAVNNPRPSRRTTVEDALRMYTVNGAWVAHEEAWRGSISVGRTGDLVVVDRDPYADPTTIEDIAVRLTIHEGAVTHDGWRD
jgi:predicted amidohydrolase YtcJ